MGSYCNNNRKRCLTPSRQTLKAREERSAKVEKVMHIIGYIMVSISVILGLAMNFMPQLFGEKQGSPAIGIGLLALAAFRLFAIRKTLQKEREQTT